MKKAVKIFFFFFFQQKFSLNRLLTITLRTFFNISLPFLAQKKKKKNFPSINENQEDNSHNLSSKHLSVNKFNIGLSRCRVELDQKIFVI